MKLKSIKPLLVIALFSFSIISCSNDNTYENDSQSETQSEETESEIQMDD